MSFLIRKLQPSQILRVQKVLSGGQARFDHWLPDYKPGPYPKTEEERVAAAKKYNLLPEEYEPYPDDGDGYGDYPKLPYKSVCENDPYYPWDDEELRRNYMDPVHVRIMNLLPEQEPTEHSQTYVWSQAIKYHLIPVIIVFGILYMLFPYHFHHGLKKQYPTPGVVHYTFELETDKAKSP